MLNFYQPFLIQTLLSFLTNNFAKKVEALLDSLELNEMETE